MNYKYEILAIVALQFVLDGLMWYIAIFHPYSYQAYWGIALAVNVILLALVMLVILRYFIRRYESVG